MRSDSRPSPVRNSTRGLRMVWFTARIGGARFVDMESLKQLFEHAAAKKTPKRISERMKQRAYASHLAREERKAEEPKVGSR